MYPDITEHVMAAQNGDRAAYDHVVLSATRGLYVFALQKTSNHHAALDLVNETFIVAWTKLHQLRNPATFYSWARQVCFRLMLTRSRSRIVHQLDSEFADNQLSQTTSPLDTLIDNEREEALYECIDQLSCSMRNTILDYYFRGKSAQDISVAENIPEASVRSRLYHARQQLKKKLAEKECSDELQP